MSFECLCIVWALEKFRAYLLDREFILVTDHKALKQLQTAPEMHSGRQLRWVLHDL